MLHVRDVANAILFSIDHNISGIYNISDQNYKIKDLADEIKNNFNKKIELKISSKMFEDSRNYRVDSSKFKRYGWVPKYNLTQGIKQIKKIIAEKRIKNFEDIIYSNARYIKEFYKWYTTVITLLIQEEALNV